ncbi:DUF927 domain-containing protein [Thiomicrorhabdus sp. zzn3]|uniref:DUF927 domain-containing protein n=1 Tax=Thiomicrorhabdus sp. zzn3 TaxID=3039775 RepID=UPI0024367F6F|nr:DUF927 domain-containing protein [Thiomicrorhabdus sp. zzn3]MDG6777690.1 DUF927 domain-containing protein [Thiomicrorhabdus sp. zzn3]
MGELQASNREIDLTEADRASEKVSIVAQRKVNELPEGYSFGENGLSYLDPHNDNANPVLICSKLEVTAMTCDTSGNNWGRVLEFSDPQGRSKKWVMPMEMLAGRGDLLHSTLLNMGLRLSTSSKAKSLLAHYIQSCTGNGISICVNRIGWFKNCYVLPDRTIGDRDGEEILFQTDHPTSLGFSVSGTPEEWRDNVAVFGIGNSRIAFAISAAFTAPLLSMLGIEGGGFHFRGESSKGKTITLYAGGSVWGGHDRKNTWRATSNGLEMTAYQHNDSLLLLDEMGEMNPRDIGNTVYMLANGQAKQRMNDATPKQWRLFFLSTGEIDLKSAMSEVGNITRAGQEVRLVDIEAVAGEYGVFDRLAEGFACSRSQAEHLQEMTGKFYGAVGQVFLERFTLLKQESLDYFKEARETFNRENAPDQANSQVQRVLNRFAIVAAGGELATSYGLTGWEQGEAYSAAKACFNSWLSNLQSAKDSQEEIQAIDQIRLFIEQHGESRFTDLDHYSESRPIKTIDKVGYRAGENDGGPIMVYYFSPSAFKQVVCKGISWKLALNALKNRGFLKHEQGKLQCRTPKETEKGKREGCYAVKDLILQDL